MREYVKDFLAGLLVVFAMAIFWIPIFLSFHTGDNRWLVFYAPLIIPIVWILGASVRRG